MIIANVGVFLGKRASKTLKVRLLMTAETNMLTTLKHARQPSQVGILVG